VRDTRCYAMCPVRDREIPRGRDTEGSKVPSVFLSPLIRVSHRRADLTSEGGCESDISRGYWMHFREDIVLVWMGGKRGTGARDWGAKSGIDAARRRRSHRSCVPRFLQQHPRVPPRVYLQEFIFGNAREGDRRDVGSRGCTPLEATRAGGYPSTRDAPAAPPR